MRKWLFHLLVISICASAYLISACKKNTGPSHPVIKLTSPADTLTINAGDTVLIEGMVSDNKSLHEVFYSFQNSTDSSVLLNESPYVHGLKEYKFSYTWITAPSPAPYVLTVQVNDHDNHTTIKEFPFTVN